MLPVVIGIVVKLVFFNREFLYAGTLEATKVDLSARLASAISAVTPQEGDHVTPNEILVSLLCDDVKVAAELANINYNWTEPARTLQLRLTR